MIKLLINQPILLASLVVGSLLFVAALIYLLVLLRRRRALNVAPKQSRPMKNLATAPQDTSSQTPLDAVTPADTSEGLSIEMPQQPSGEIALPVLGAAEKEPEKEPAPQLTAADQQPAVSSDVVADTKAMSAHEKAETASVKPEKPKTGSKFTLFRRKKKAKPTVQDSTNAHQKSAMDQAAEKATDPQASTQMTQAGIVAAAPHQSNSEKRLSNRLMSIEQEMLALKELYQDVQITRDVYVNETRHLYGEAEKLVQN